MIKVPKLIYVTIYNSTGIFKTHKKERKGLTPPSPPHKPKTLMENPNLVQEY